MIDDKILDAIDEEIDRLQKVRRLLATLLATDNQSSLATEVSARKRRRRLSAATRKKIAEGQRKRWAKQKAARK